MISEVDTRAATALRVAATRATFVGDAIDAEEPVTVSQLNALVEALAQATTQARALSLRRFPPG
ncbi:hypothetical protein UO65_2832 [Actinokineospora spheciospongiae]|uniref:Uncharacterized protein n=1 Tax=Actinokineospora spheciospongiae TaxID=909613 RepID=W7J770_9PSEU|nr:hypothetical protein [Actinokineospora spheciospongiae]EWC61899.1 hypothetical protein UO65_2832 [Actinokineospora spheciospongiae]